MTSMVPLVLIMIAVASLFIAMALWLFSHAHQREKEQSAAEHLKRSVKQRLSPSLMQTRDAALGEESINVIGALEASAQEEGWQGWLNQHLGLRAWGITPVAFAILAGIGLVLSLLALAQIGPVAAALVLAVYGLLAAFGVWQRMNKRRHKLLEQLPGFLDNMVRLLSIGNSPHASFQMAVGSVPAPLGDALQEASGLLRVNPDIGESMEQLERTWGLHEFGLLAAVFRMSTRYGGRADLVLERVAAYIRDRQSAERELRALSAEIRLSAWILALLPIVVGALIMVLNSGYFMRMWEDEGGKNMILLAAGLQAGGSFILYRLARLK